MNEICSSVVIKFYNSKYIFIVKKIYFFTFLYFEKRSRVLVKIKWLILCKYFLLDKVEYYLAKIPTKYIYFPIKKGYIYLGVLEISMTTTISKILTKETLKIWQQLESDITGNCYINLEMSDNVFKESHQNWIKILLSKVIILAAKPNVIK